MSNEFSTEKDSEIVIFQEQTEYFREVLNVLHKNDILIKDATLSIGDESITITLFSKR